MIKIINFMICFTTIKKITITLSADKDMEQLELSDVAGRKVQVWEIVWPLLIKLKMHLT